MPARYARTGASASEERMRNELPPPERITASSEERLAHGGLELRGGVGVDRVEAIAGRPRNPPYPYVRPVVEADQLHQQREAIGPRLQLSGYEIGGARVMRHRAPVARVARAAENRGVAV